MRLVFVTFKIVVNSKIANINDLHLISVNMKFSPLMLVASGGEREKGFLELLYWQPSSLLISKYQTGVMHC